MNFYILKKSNYDDKIHVVDQDDHNSINNLNINGYLIVDIIDAKNCAHAIRIFHAKKKFNAYDNFAVICKILSIILVFISVITLISSIANIFFSRLSFYSLDVFLNSYIFCLIISFLCGSLFFFLLSLSITQLKEDMTYIKTM